MEATILTALATVLVLAIVTVLMVRHYVRTHQDEIRQGLLSQARHYSVATPEALGTAELQRQVRAAKRAHKHRNMKTA